MLKTKEAVPVLGGPGTASFNLNKKLLRSFLGFLVCGRSSFALAPRHHDVEDDRGQRSRDDAALQQHGRFRRKLAEHRRHGGGTEADGEAACHDHQIAFLAQVDFRENAHAGSGDGAEHDDHGAAQHGAGHDGRQRRELRQQAEQHHDGAGSDDDAPLLDLRQRNEPDILGEGRIREGVEDASQHDRSSLRAEAVHDLLLVDLLVGRLADSEVYAGRFHHADDIDEDHRHDGDEAHMRSAEVERLRDAEPRSVPDAGEADHAHRIRGCCACGKAHEHRDGSHEAFGEAADDQNDDEGEQRQQQIARSAEVSRSLTAGGVVHRDRDERKPDNRDDRSGDDGREETQQLAVQRCGQKNEQAGQDDGSVYGRKAVFLADDDHRPDRRERAAEHDREAAAEEARFHDLQKSGEAAGEQVGGDQIRDLGRREPELSSDDQRNDDGARIHGEHMLKAERDGFAAAQHPAPSIPAAPAAAGSASSSLTYVTRPGAIEAIRARECTSTPRSSSRPRPSWKLFSMTQPTPHNRAPDCLTISTRPTSAAPVARKSSTIRTRSSGPR
ncbi:hypothetical protein BN871_CJ_00080 [Paenibacillus sp. P22]|nr:hypothetical protein BN871_CJ_00080 [Paenibacillus sp. P22]